MRLTALVLDFGGVLTDTGGTDGEPPLVDVVRRARAAGVRTALLSNADSRAELPLREFDFAALFDEVVVSGEVGVRKPDPRIYRLTAERLGVEPAECVFVDDLPGNVHAAVGAGMVGVRHESVESTVLELSALFDALPIW